MWLGGSVYLRFRIVADLPRRRYFRQTLLTALPTLADLPRQGLTFFNRLNSNLKTTGHAARAMSTASDDRRAPRLRTFKGGLITFGAAPTVDCLIRNMSETGAALEAESTVSIPVEFTLVIKPEFVKRNCRVAWRSDRRIGVRFV
jgi:hypothetical protein